MYPYPAYASAVTALIVFAVGCRYLWRHPFAIQFFLVYILMGVCVDAVNFLFAVQRINNIAIGSVHFLLQVPMLAAVYYWTWPRPTNRWLWVSVLMLYTIASLYELDFIQHRLNDINTYTRVAGSVLLVIIAMCYLMLSRQHTMPISPAMFWISIGIIIYFTAGIYFFGYRNYMMHEEMQNFRFFWSAHNLVRTAMNVFFIIGLARSKPQPISVI